MNFCDLKRTVGLFVLMLLKINTKVFSLFCFWWSLAQCFTESLKLIKRLIFLQTSCQNKVLVFENQNIFRLRNIGRCGMTVYIVCFKKDEIYQMMNENHKSEIPCKKRKTPNNNAQNTYHNIKNKDWTTPNGGGYPQWHQSCCSYKYQNSVIIQFCKVHSRNWGQDYGHDKCSIIVNQLG